MKHITRLVFIVILSIVFGAPAFAATSVTTLSATNITKTSAVVGGTVTAVDGTPAAIMIYLQYGNSSFQYNSQSPLIAASNANTFPGINLPATYTLSGLTCGTTYYYRVVVSTTTGVGYGAEKTFQTSSCLTPITMNNSLITSTVVSTTATTTSTTTNPITITTLNPITTQTLVPTSLILVPTVTTDVATAITKMTASLGLQISSSGGASVTTYGFNYGTTSSYGNTISVTNTYSIPLTTSKNLTGLTCGTTYHYRAYATNSQGTAYGSDKTFTTLACAQPISNPITTLTTTTIPVITNPTTLPNPDTVTVITPPQNTNTGGVTYGYNSNGTTAQYVPTVTYAPLRPKTKTPNVAVLQWVLKVKKFYTGNIDGSYGPKTKAAVKSFQLVTPGLKVDGYAGIRTLTSLGITIKPN